MNSKPNKESPIGIFDSGLGGLSVMKAVRTLLPAEDLYYVGDCKYTPYGDKSNDFIIERSLKIANFLMGGGIKAFVVACNTATAAAVPTLRKELSIPVIGIEPAIKPAIHSTKTKAVGVMATTATINSERFKSLLERFKTPDVTVVPVACKGLADAVERNECEAESTLELLAKYLKDIQEANCDKVVLGCTHYPFVANSIRKILNNPNVELIDPSAAVARELKRQLANKGFLREEDFDGQEVFWISGQADAHQGIISKLWGEEIIPKNVPSLG